MTDSAAAVLRQYAIDASLGVLGGAVGNWPWFLGGEPESPDNCVTVYDTDGIDHGRAMKTGQIVEAEGVLIRVRAVNYQIGWSKANEIRNKLMLKETGDPYRVSVTISDRDYVLQSVVGIGNIIPIGKALPNSRLNLFTLNVLVNYTSA